MRVALLHNADPRVLNNSWIGTIANIRRALGRHLGVVECIGPAPVSLLPYRAARHLVRILSNRTYSFHHDQALSRRLGRYFTRALRACCADVAIVVNDVAIAAHLETDVPLVLFSDATWPLVRDLYDDYRNPLARTDRDASAIERRAMLRANLLLYPSDWAARSAIEHYHLSDGVAATIPIGANLIDPPPSAVCPGPLDPTVHLLWIGMRWDAKGGDVAVETLRMLLERGIDADLTIVGCTPPPHVAHPRLHVVGFLDTATADGRARLAYRLHHAHVLLLPSRYEAVGIVICEASAYGVPSIAPDIGGVASVLRDGVNGRLLAPDADAADYAGAVAALVADPAAYARLRTGARAEFDARLNWNAWGATAAALIRDRFERSGTAREDK